MIVVWLFCLYIAVYYITEYLEKRKSPPGPIPIPLVGNLIQIASASNIPSLAFAKFAKEYGDVFQLRMGMKTMVVPASVESITTIFSRSEASGRDRTGSWQDRNFNKNLGIVFSDGPIWEKTKHWAIRSLRDYGFGKTSTMESSFKEELEILFNGIDKTRASNNNIVPVSDLFILSVFKIMWHMVAGRLTEDDEKIIFQLLMKSAKALSKGVFGAGLVTAYPFVRYIIPETTGHAAQMEFYQDAHKAARRLMAESRTTIASRGENNVQPENLVEAFVCKLDEEKGDPDTIFIEDNFICIYMDLMQASSDTNSSFLEAFVLFMVLYPDVQAKVYKEIERFVPEGEEITFAFRKQMIYTQACMLEIHRHTKVVQNLVPRKVLQDFYYKKYLIKKGTIMVANLHAAYFSAETWDAPYEFRPERFIGENGEIVKQNCIFPFGVGKRLCPGEQLAHVTEFLYTVSILQRYKLSTVPGKTPRQEMHEGFTSKPYTFEAVFSARK